MYSKAEQNVITYLESGYSNQDIAYKLCISKKTVKFHLTSVYKKAGVKSRSEFISKKYEQDSKTNKGEIMALGNKNVDILPSTEQDKRNVRPLQKSQEDKIVYIDEKFMIGNTISQLHTMMKEVTKQEINPATVNAACNCVARLNETINTAIMAAKFLNER